MPIFYVLQPLNANSTLRQNLERLATAVRASGAANVLRWRYSEAAGFAALVIDGTNGATAHDAGLGVLREAWQRGLYKPNEAQVMTFRQCEVEAAGGAAGLFPPLAEIPAPAAPLPVGPPDDNPLPPAAEEPDTVAGDNCGRLLEWLTAAGSGRWEVFARVAVELRAVDVEGAAAGARALARRLTALGHVEWSPGGDRWRVAPPVLVASAAGLLWCGGRTESMRAALPTGWRVTADYQPYAAAPPRWLVTGPPGADPAAAFGALEPNPHFDRPRFAGDVPGWLATRLPAAGELPEAPWLRLATLASTPDHQERFDGHDFVSVSSAIRVAGDGPTGDAAGLYRLAYNGPPLQTFVAHFDPARRPERRTLRGDWNTLRFLIPGKRWAQHVRSESRDWLNLSADGRWPAPHERALVLCSGLLPRYTWDRREFWFPDVPIDVAGRLAHRLGVNFSQTAAEEHVNG